MSLFHHPTNELSVLASTNSQSKIPSQTEITLWILYANKNVQCILAQSMWHKKWLVSMMHVPMNFVLLSDLC